MPKSDGKSKRALIDSDSDDEEDLEEVRIMEYSNQIMIFQVASSTWFGNFLSLAIDENGQDREVIFPIS